MPAVVTDATAAYFEEQDLIAQWLAERCEPKATAETSSSAMFRDWSAWVTARGEQPGTQKAFSAVVERHYAKKKKPGGIMFLGIRILPSDTGVT